MTTSSTTIVEAYFQFVITFNLDVDITYADIDVIDYATWHRYRPKGYALTARLIIAEKKKRDQHLFGVSPVSFFSDSLSD